MTLPKNYDDWLALTIEQQKHINQSVWKTNNGEGLPFALIAASRLAMSSAKKIRNIATGIWHGGEHVLHLTVSEEEFKTCPSHLSQIFEGFRVIWMCERFLPSDYAGEIAGEWVSEVNSSDAVFHLNPTETGMAIEGHIYSTGERLSISNININELWVIFSAFGPESGYEADHCFDLVSPDRCKDRETKLTYWKRLKKNTAEQDAAANP